MERHVLTVRVNGEKSYDSRKPAKKPRISATTPVVFTRMHEWLLFELADWMTECLDGLDDLGTLQRRVSKLDGKPPNMDTMHAATFHFSRKEFEYIAQAMLVSSYRDQETISFGLHSDLADMLKWEGEIHAVLPAKGE